MKLTKKKLAEMYRDWLNNFSTIVAFANWDGMSHEQAFRVIRLGVKAHNRRF
jgi:hypothetical protein